MKQTLRLFASIVLVTAATSVYGQFGMPASDGVTATGSVQLSLQPSMMEMTIQIEGRSSDLPQAVAELKRRIKVALQRLEELDATDDRVTVSKPRLKVASGSEDAETFEMMLEQYGGGQRGREMLEQTRSVSVIQSVTARWTLAGKDDSERLVKTHELSEKIKAADIASAGDQQPISDAQAELAAEMEAMMEEYSYGEQTTKTGEPEFSYIAILSAAQYQDAVLKAFQDAKQQIESLAKLTHTGVRPVQALTSSIRVAGESEYSPYTDRGQNQATRDQDSGGYQLEANDPNHAECTVTVAAIGRYAE